MMKTFGEHLGTKQDVGSTGWFLFPGNYRVFPQMMYRFLGILLSQIAWKTLHIPAVNGKKFSPGEHAPEPP